LGLADRVLYIRFHRPPERPPIMKVQKTVLAGAGGGRGPAVLLRSVHPIGKLIVGRDVIKLPRRLVEPRAPRLASVVRHDRPLVATQNHALSIIWINPKFVIVRSRWIAFEHGEALSPVDRPIDRSIRHIHDVRVFRIDGNFVEVDRKSTRLNSSHDQISYA